MSKPSVLITIDWFLPGTKSGGPVRSYANLIDHLSNAIDFYIITRDTDYCETKPYSSVESNSWNKLKSGAQVYYLSKDRINLSGISDVIRSRHFDYVLINGIYSWYFSILPLLVLKNHPNIIISARGMLNDQAFSVKPLKKKLFIKLAKVLGLYKRRVFHATNSIEAVQIKKWIGKNSTIKIAPNIARKSLAKYQPIELAAPVKLINVARIAKEKGTLRMLEALSRIKSPISLDIYGSVYDQAYWNKCLKIINELPSDVTVQYKGIADSEKIPEILKEYNFFVMLSEGENFGHAILEALSSGLPVIISNKTPWLDLQSAEVGWDLDLNYEDRIVGVLDGLNKMDTAQYRNMSEKAFKYANQFINDIKVIDANKNLFLP